MNDFRVKVRGTPEIIADGFRSKAAACKAARQSEALAIPPGSFSAVVQGYDAGSADSPGDWFAVKCPDADAPARRRRRR